MMHIIYSWSFICMLIPNKSVGNGFCSMNSGILRTRKLLKKGISYSLKRLYHRIIFLWFWMLLVLIALHFQFWIILRWYHPGLWSERWQLTNIENQTVNYTTPSFIKPWEISGASEGQSDLETYYDMCC